MSTHPTSLLRPTRRTVIGGLLGAAATASGIALTATSGWLIVRASEEPIILTLLVAIVAVRTFGIARPFFRYLERLVSHDAALDDLAVRRTSVYAALVPITPARLGRRSRSSVLTSVVDDLTDVVEAQVRVTVPVLSSTLAGLVAVLLTAWFSPAVGLVLAGLLVAVAGTCGLAWLLESRSRDELLESRAEVLRVSDLVARQASELQAIGAAGTATGWLADAHDTLRAAVRRQSRGRALVAATLFVATAVATLAAALLVDPSATGGPVAALLVVVPVAVGDALAPLVDTMRYLARAQGSGARLDALLDQEPAVTDSAAAVAGGIRTSGRVVDLDGVAASWAGHGEQLPPTDLHLTPGRRVAVIGPNGSGKSTLLAVLARYLDPSRGQHAVDGHSVRDLTVEDVRRHVAVVDDEPHVFAASVAANLRVAGPDADDDAVAAALGRAGLGRWLAELPDGLATRLGSGGRGLSGGERARLGVARAVLADRPLVLLDEPTAHLDHATATAVLDDVLSATDGRSVVMVSHRPEALDRFDTVLDLGARHPATPTPKE
ncbi:MAG TPA: thiol reductant ABC exporter subunit CydC [Ornithinibacter sp.]|nr:thiol reductant ABC exporter subunit CydC [Ornithinibacter sp.]